MLLPSASVTQPGLSRREVLGTVAAGGLTCLLPKSGHTSVQAQLQANHDDPQTRNRIYVSGMFRHKEMVIAIDPDTGNWQKVTDDGSAVRVSPDRHTMVFSRYQQSADRSPVLRSCGIWNCDTRGSNSPRRISDKSGRPIWSPDGKYLVATKQEHVDGHKKDEPAWKDETWRMDADGSNPTRLPIPDTDWVEDWSPDGQWFITGSDRHPPHGASYQIYLMKVDGTQQRRLTAGRLNVGARFCPDGRKIVYLCQTAKGENSIWVVDVDGQNAREILKEADLAAPCGVFWSPDGKQLAVILFDWQLDEKGKKFGNATKDANFRIQLMDADGHNRQELKLANAESTFIDSCGDWR
jgi:Tol biopolymer transport system component